MSLFNALFREFFEVETLRPLMLPSPSNAVSNSSGLVPMASRQECSATFSSLNTNNGLTSTSRSIRCVNSFTMLNPNNKELMAIGEQRRNSTSIKSGNRTTTANGGRHKMAAIPYRPTREPAPAKRQLDTRRYSSSISEGAWKNSLRNNGNNANLMNSSMPEMAAKQEKLLPAIPNVAASRNYNKTRDAMRTKSMDRATKRQEKQNSKCDESSRRESLSSPEERSSTSKRSPSLAASTTATARATGSDAFADFARRQKLDPSLISDLSHEILSRAPNVHWRDIAGLEGAKSLLQEAIVLPLIMPEFFRGIRRPWKGILMIGPPGTGKTLLAKAVATECKTTFFNVASSSLTSKFRGESEKLVRHLFELARFHAPSIIFIDEIDALCSQRGSQSEHEASKRFKAELLTQMDGLAGIDNDDDDNNNNNNNNNNEEHKESQRTVMVLAATNYPWLIDEAFRRRFEKRIHIDLPDSNARRRLLQLNLSSLSIDASVDLDSLCDRLDSYSGADMTTLCRDAAMMSMRRVIKNKSLDDLKELTMEQIDKPVSQADFDEAIERCKRTSSDHELKRYKEWMDKHGSI